MRTTETDLNDDARALAEEQVLGLVIVHHPSDALVGARELMPAKRTILLGRAEESAFLGAFEGARFSRRHLEITSDGESLALTDLQSRNGTFLNGVRIQRATATPGSVVRIGDVLSLVQRAPRIFPDPPSKLLVGISAKLARLKAQIELAASMPIVTIVGETGTGKELVARSLHDKSCRAGAFVAINCAAIADGVLHSELFGHVGGAFSGAQSPREGLVAAARKGTLFLDEIGSATPAFQSSLLRLMESGDYRPVGANVAKQAEVGFVTALQPNIGELLDANLFRRDLWTRMSRWVIPVPPLAERREDIPRLAVHFAREIAGGDVPLSSDFAEGLMRCDWPGNIRELRGFVERAYVIQRKELAAGASLRWMEEFDALFAVATSRPEGGAELARKPPTARPSRETLSAWMRAHGNNVAAVARAQNVPRKTIYRWLEALGLPTGDTRGHT